MQTSPVQDVSLELLDVEVNDGALGVVGRGAPVSVLAAAEVNVYEQNGKRVSRYVTKCKMTHVGEWDASS